MKKPNFHLEGLQPMGAFSMESSDEAYRPYIRFLTSLITLAAVDYAKVVKVDKFGGYCRSRLVRADGQSAKRWMYGNEHGAYPFDALCGLFGMTAKQVIKRCEDDPDGVIKRAGLIFHH